MCLWVLSFGAHRIQRPGVVRATSCFQADSRCRRPLPRPLLAEKAMSLTAARGLKLEVQKTIGGTNTHDAPTTHR